MEGLVEGGEAPARFPSSAGWILPSMYVQGSTGNPTRALPTRPVRPRAEPGNHAHSCVRPGPGRPRPRLRRGAPIPSPPRTGVFHPPSSSTHPWVRVSMGPTWRHDPSTLDPSPPGPRPRPPVCVCVCVRGRSSLPAFVPTQDEQRDPPRVRPPCLSLLSRSRPSLSKGGKTEARAPTSTT
eukprot:scaffold416_cov329-Pavlova_lutheri.AAC.42